ncbi:MAG: DNA primase [Metamycoplasmataceae bacterium]
MKLQEAIENVDIVEVISDFSTIVSSGNSLKIICKVHNDSNPSVSISREKRIFKCFSCGVGGNVITYLKEFEKMKMPEIIDYLNRKYNFEIDNFYEKINEKKYTDEQEKMIEVFKDVVSFFSYSILKEERNKNSELNNFLLKRKLNKELLKTFNIGYAPINDKNSKNYLSFLLEKGHDLATIMNCFLVDEKENVIFSNRIIFPIKNDFGDIVGLSGRKLDDNQPGPKYINSKESLVFKKNEIFYNFNYIKEQEEKEVIICEGYMDVIALWKINIKNAIAIMGTNLTINHIKKLLNKKIIIFLDGDPAGQQAALKICTELIKAKIETSIIVNTYAKDPDEIINKYEESKEIIESLFANSISSFKFIINKIEENFDLKNENNIMPFLQKIKKVIELAPEIIQKKIIKDISNKLSIDYLEIIKTLNLSYDKLNLDTKQINNPTTKPNNLEEQKELIFKYTERMIISFIKQKDLLKYYFINDFNINDPWGKYVISYIAKNDKDLPEEYKSKIQFSYDKNEIQEIKEYLIKISKRHNIYPKNLSELKDNYEYIQKEDNLRAKEKAIEEIIFKKDISPKELAKILKEYNKKK